MSPPHPTLVFICWSCKLYLSYLLFVALWCREPRTTSPPLEVTAMLVPLPPHPSRQWASSTLCPYMLEILYCLKMVCSITNILRAPNINSTSHLVLFALSSLLPTCFKLVLILFLLSYNQEKHSEGQHTCWELAHPHNPSRSRIMAVALLFQLSLVVRC